MPLYDYECLRCGEAFEAFRRIEEREYALCPKCGFIAEQVLKQAKRDFTHRIEGWWRDISPEGPVYVRSKRHLKELCKRHGVYAKCLD